MTQALLHSLRSFRKLALVIDHLLTAAVQYSTIINNTCDLLKTFACRIFRKQFYKLKKVKEYDHISQK